MVWNQFDTTDKACDMKIQMAAVQLDNWRAQCDQPMCLSNRLPPWTRTMTQWMPRSALCLMLITCLGIALNHLCDECFTGGTDNQLASFLNVSLPALWGALLTHLLNRLNLAGSKAIWFKNSTPLKAGILWNKCCRLALSRRHSSSWEAF